MDDFPTTAEGWAIRLSVTLRAFNAAHGTERFPVKVAELARHISREYFPDEPISMIKGDELSDAIDGMLRPKPDGSGEWGIIYNNAPDRTTGRINFTLAHEFGHYLLHRKEKPKGFSCSSKAMMDWSSDYAKMEGEANTFASFLLMPLDDFREQIKGNTMSVELIKHLADRYEVSLTAAVLKWLSITKKRAMLVVGKSGFIDWAWSSTPLIKTGVFYRARQEVIPLPEPSSAGLALMGESYETVVQHDRGVWIGDEPVTEHIIVSPRHEVTISLLVYPDRSSSRLYKGSGFEDESDWDSYDQFKAYG